MARGDKLQPTGGIDLYRQRLLREAWDAADPEDCDRIAELFAARKSRGSQEIAAGMREIARQLRSERPAAETACHDGRRAAELP
jgi:hypothetical protein